VALRIGLPALWKAVESRVAARTWSSWAAVGALLLGTILRVGWPRLSEFKFSEARLEALALELTRDGRLPLVGVPSSAGFDHSPVSVYLYVPAFVATTDPIPATIYGALAGAAAVALAWWLARRWPGGGRQEALVTALFFAVSPWAVSYSRKIWQVTFVPLLALAFVALAVSALVGSAPGRRECPWHLTWALAVLALLVQVHPSAITLVPALGFWLLVFRRQVRWQPVLVGGGLAALTMVPFLVHQVRSGWPVLAAYHTLPPPVWDLSAVRLAWQAVTGQGIQSLAGRSYHDLTLVPTLVPLFAVLGWLILAACLWLGWRVARQWHAGQMPLRQLARVDLVLISWLLLPVLFDLQHSLELHLHFFTLILPAAYLVLGRAAGDVLPRIWRPLRVGMVTGLALVAGLQLLALVWMGKFVATHDTEGGFGLPLGRYQDLASQVLDVGQESGSAEILIVASGDLPVVHDVPAILDVLLRGKAMVRFVDGRGAALFPPHTATVLLAPGAGDAAGWYLAWAGQDLGHGYSLVVLDGNWPQALVAIHGPRLFENGVELQAYRWDQGTASLWLLWQVLWQSPGESHFSVRLLNGAGGLSASQDGPGYPPDYRRKGDRILSLFRLKDGGSPETVWLEVGQYLFPQVIDIPVVDSVGNKVSHSVLAGPLAEE
jgi:hypothetical protein